MNLVNVPPLWPLKAIKESVVDPARLWTSAVTPNSRSEPSLCLHGVPVYKRKQREGNQTEAGCRYLSKHSGPWRPWRPWRRLPVIPFTGITKQTALISRYHQIFSSRHEPTSLMKAGEEEGWQEPGWTRGAAPGCQEPRHSSSTELKKTTKPQWQQRLLPFPSTHGGPGIMWRKLDQYPLRTHARTRAHGPRV